MSHSAVSFMQCSVIMCITFAPSLSITSISSHFHHTYPHYSSLTVIIGLHSL